MARRNGRPGEHPRNKALAVFWRVLGRGALGFLIFTGVSGVLLMAYVAAASSPMLSFKTPVVAGTKYLSRFEVLSAAGLGAHSNLAALPVGLLEQRIAKLRWVKQVNVQRRLPDTVEITVLEHDPTHLALVEGRLYYLNQDLSAHAPLKLGEIPPDRPVITGLSRAELAEPDAEIKGLLNQAGRLLELLYLSASKGGHGLSEIHLDRLWGLSLVWQDLTATVRLGLGDYDRKLKRLTRVRKDLKSRGELERAILIDLSDAPRAVVRFGG
jgi:cell division protein FtsQ